MGKIIPEWYDEQFEAEWDYNIMLLKEQLVRCAITMQMPELYLIAKDLK